MPILDLRVRFRILTFLAQNELGYVSIKISLKLGGFVGAVDDPAIVRRAGICLGTELKSKILDEIYSVVSIASRYVTSICIRGGGRLNE